MDNQATNTRDERHDRTLSCIDWEDLLLDYESSDPGSENRNELRSVLAYRLAKIENQLAALRSLNLVSLKYGREENPK